MTRLTRLFTARIKPKKGDQSPNNRERKGFKRKHIDTTPEYVDAIADRYMNLKERGVQLPHDFETFYAYALYDDAIAIQKGGKYNDTNQ